MGDGTYIYYANYYEGDCNVPAQSVYVVEPASYPEEPNQICPDCEHRVTDRDHFALDTIDHKYGLYKFNGLPSGGTGMPYMSATTVLVNDYYRDLYLPGSGAYKAHIFDLFNQHANRRMVLAIEIDSYPTGVPHPPVHLGNTQVKNCQGRGAYSVKYFGSRMLFLTK
jgi:hypothetical protein